MTGERNTEILNKGRAVRPRRTDRELRRFGGVMAVALVVLSLLVLWRHIYTQSKGDSLRLISEEADGGPHRRDRLQPLFWVVSRPT